MKKRLFVLLLIALLIGPILAGPASADSKAPQKKTAPGVYYDFPDIMVPRELELKKDESFVYQADSLTAGELVFSGRVEVTSLTEFFIKAMLHDQWLLAAKFTRPRILLQFDKPGQRAVIYITESAFSTRVEIYSGPLFVGGKD